MAVMRARNLVILAAITIVVIVAAAFISISRAPQSGKEKALLFPDLKDALNSAGEVVITGEGRTVNLAKQNDRWVVRQAGGYPATFEKIRSLLLNMATLRVVAEKTSNPELYSRIGVEDPQGQGAASHLVELKDGQGKQLAGLIVGDARKGSSPMESPAVYVRRPGQAQSLLAEGELPVSSQITDWFDQQLFSIKPDRIESVTLRHPGEKPVVVSRPEKGGDFTIEPVPEGRKPQSEVVLTRMGSILEDIFANNVASASDFTFPDDHVNTTIRTFDGLVATARATSQDGRNYVAFDFSVDESRVPEQMQDSGIEDGSEDAKAPGSGKGDEPGVRQEVANINETVSGWVYTLPEHRFELYTRSLEDLTRPE